MVDGVASTQFVAEFTTNHMGNLNLLLRMAEAAAEAGCDFIKMQKKDVDSFYSQEKLDAPYKSPYGATYRDYRRLFEFGEEDFRRFDEKCRSLGVGWFATVQDEHSLDFMLGFELPKYKIASSNARNHEFLRRVSQRVPTTSEIVLSVAGSTLSEIQDALDLFPQHRIHLLHCVAEYPCTPGSLRLGNIVVLKQQFENDRISVGYSGHDEGLPATLAAISLGAKMVERHFCMSRHSFVHHIECSLQPEEFHELTRVARSGKDLRPFYLGIPEEAFLSQFGMSPVERSFLVDQVYGRAHMKAGASF